MTLYERVWLEAAETFGRQRGFRNPLSPYTRTWRLVIDRAEHALWLWNEKYGPLNRSQRELAGDLICHALRRGREAPDCNAAYAYFNTTLTSALNHEYTDEQMKIRGDSEADVLGDFVGDFAGVPA